MSTIEYSIKIDWDVVDDRVLKMLRLGEKSKMFGVASPFKPDIGYNAQYFRFAGVEGLVGVLRSMKNYRSIVGKAVRGSKTKYFRGCAKDFETVAESLRALAALCLEFDPFMRLYAEAGVHIYRPETALMGQHESQIRVSGFEWLFPKYDIKVPVEKLVALASGELKLPKIQMELKDD